MNNNLTLTIYIFASFGLIAIVATINIFIGSACHHANDEHLYIIFSTFIEVILLICVLAIRIGVTKC